MKYLEIKIDKDFNCHDQINIVAAKLTRASSVLAKLGHFVNFSTIKSIYQEVFESHLNYLLLVWVQNANSIKRYLVLQKKSLRIMNFLKRNAHTSNLFKKFKWPEASR